MGSTRKLLRAAEEATVQCAVYAKWLQYHMRLSLAFATFVTIMAGVQIYLQLR